MSAHPYRTPAELAAPRRLPWWRRLACRLFGHAWREVHDDPFRRETAWFGGMLTLVDCARCGRLDRVPSLRVHPPRCTCLDCVTWRTAYHRAGFP